MNVIGEGINTTGVTGKQMVDGDIVLHMLYSMDF